MNTEPIIPIKKPRSDCILKNQPPEAQEDIAEFAHAHSLEETRQWIYNQRHIQCSISTISRFLAWFRAGERVAAGQSAVEALMERMLLDHPDWAPEKIRALGQAYLALAALEKDDVNAWARVQQVDLKRERLALDREKFQRHAVEEVINICNDPKVRQTAQDDDQSYREKVRLIRKVMFGDGPAKGPKVTDVQQPTSKRNVSSAPRK